LSSSSPVTDQMTVIPGGIAGGIPGAQGLQATHGIPAPHMQPSSFQG